ncbi:MAG TPA: hypothetical protein VFR02_01220 [bacterium]|nr:hypothetical protein [bacterium]
MFFLILQTLFDAVMLAALVFIFHFTNHQMQKKKEEADLLKSLQVQEIRDQLQELLMTLKQLGKEVSDDIQAQVLEAETKTELIKKITVKIQRDLKRTLVLAEEVNAEKKRLEEKAQVLRVQPKKPAARAEEGLERMPVQDADMVRLVYRLADTQMDLDGIAKQTKLTQAEIQLILNLRGNRFSTPN